MPRPRSPASPPPAPSASPAGTAPAAAPAAPPIGSARERQAAVDAFRAEQAAPPPGTDKPAGETATPAPAGDESPGAASAPGPGGAPAAPAKPAEEQQPAGGRLTDRDIMRMEAELKRQKKEMADQIAAAKKLDGIRQRILSDPKGALEELGAGGAAADVYKRLFYQLAPDTDPEKLTPEQKEQRALKDKLSELEAWKSQQEERIEQDRWQRFVAEKRGEVTSAIAKDSRYRAFLALGAEERAVEEIMQHLERTTGAGDPRVLTASEALDMLLPEAESTGDRLADNEWMSAKVVEKLRAKGWTIAEPGKAAATAVQPKSPAADPVQTIDSHTAAERPAGTLGDQDIVDNPHLYPRSVVDAAALRLARS